MPSRAKRRKIGLTKKPVASDASRVASVTYNELYKAIAMLGQLQKKQHAELELLAEHLSEVSLRVRYIMQHFKFEKGSRMLGLDGMPIVGEIATLFDRYNAERDRFLASLAQELMPHDQAADSDAGTESRGASGTPVAANGTAAAGVASGPRLVHGDSAARVASLPAS